MHDFAILSSPALLKIYELLAQRICTCGIEFFRVKTECTENSQNSEEGQGSEREVTVRLSGDIEDKDQGLEAQASSDEMVLGGDPIHGVAELVIEEDLQFGQELSCDVKFSVRCGRCAA